MIMYGSFLCPSTHIMHIKFPVSMVVLGVMSSKRHVILPLFFGKVCGWMLLATQGARNSLRWKTVYVLERLSVFRRLHDHITLNMWLSNLPNLNPLDYYIRGFVERETNQCSHNTTDPQKTAITWVMSNTDDVYDSGPVLKPLLPLQLINM